eukprot:CAMPEP_0174923488 /NCGR_PEP_ID=MMETSP1355-20121228/6621_1 /TAXON_ID=464990 /ORGANISM="Hemiselmis tepida, Strain CCMP443" /LENGTH=129 /DNA_ID=CAMNT_0016169177 /DNA_START=210 /DNA_END=595 /DNA_ORIENTATION=-
MRKLGSDVQEKFALRRAHSMPLGQRAPLGHGVHSLAPAGEYEFCSQGSHEMEPGTLECVPAGQERHDEKPESKEKPKSESISIARSRTLSAPESANTANLEPGNTATPCGWLSFANVPTPSVFNSTNCP